MDNHERGKRYLLQHYPAISTAERADAELRFAYRDGTASQLLTPAQRRRVRHKRGTSSYGRRREAIGQRELRALAHWGHASKPDSASLLRQVQTGLARIGLRKPGPVPEQDQPWAEPEADIKGDLREMAGKPQHRLPRKTG